MRVIVRMWTGNGYHKDVAVLDDKQVRMTYGNMNPGLSHIIHPVDAVRVLITPSRFPESTEFEVIVER